MVEQQPERRGGCVGVTGTASAKKDNKGDWIDKRLFD